MLLEQLKEHHSVIASLRIRVPDEADRSDAKHGARPAHDAEHHTKCNKLQAYPAVVFPRPHASRFSSYPCLSSC